MKNQEKLKDQEEILIGMKEVDEKPPYPEEPLKGKASQFTSAVPPDSGGGVEKSVAIDVKQLCGDLVKASFQVAHIIKPKIREASDSEVRNIGEPLANVIEKYDLMKYAKYLNYTQEVLLVYNITKAVSIRVKEVRESPTVPEE